MGAELLLTNGNLRTERLYTEAGRVPIRESLILFTGEP